jgi:hypothetical protein
VRGDPKKPIKNREYASISMTDEMVRDLEKERRERGLSFIADLVKVTLVL